MTPADHRGQRGGVPAVLLAGSGEAATYAELDDRSMRFARRLHAHGLRPGGRVAILLENRAEWFVAFWAIMRSGAYVVPINAHLDPVETGAMVELSGATVLVTSSRFDEHVAAMGARRLANVTLRLDVDEDADAIAAFPAKPLPREWAGEVMFFSGGTTGRPKTVVPPLSGSGFGERPNVLAALFQARWDFGPDTVLLTCAPLYHAGPLGFGAAVQRLGGTVVVLEEFDAAAALEAIERHQVTHALFVPMHLRRLLDLDEATRTRFDLSSLTHVIHGAGPCPVPVKQRVIDWLGKIVHEYYVGSEGNGFTICDSEEWLERPGTVGKPLAGTVHVLDAAGNELPPGERGELWFETGSQFEYEGDPEATAAANDLDRGWTTLGDVGHVDADGFLHLAGRPSDLVPRRAATVSLQELELALLAHADVHDAAVVAEGGDLVALVVPRTDEPALDGIDVDRVVLVDDLPRLPTGKLLKRRLVP